MSNSQYRVPNAASRAASIAADFISSCRGRHDNQRQAIAFAARQCGIGFSTFRSFVQPSRQPKAVSADLWQRLLAGYERHLRRELAVIETRLVHIEAVDTPDRELRALAAEAERLAARIHAAAGDGAA